MNKKLLLFLFQISVLFGLALQGYSQQLNELNPYYAESQNKLRQAEEALDAGDYNKSEVLTAEARQLADKADQFNFILFMKYRSYGYKVNAEYQLKKAANYDPANNLIIRNDYSNAGIELAAGNTLFPTLDANGDMAVASNNGVLAVSYFSNAFHLAATAADNGKAIYLLGKETAQWKEKADGINTKVIQNKINSNPKTADLYQKFKSSYDLGNELYPKLPFQSNMIDGVALYQRTIGAYSNATFAGSEAIDNLLNTDKQNDARKLYAYAAKRLGEAEESPQASVYADKLSEARTNLSLSKEALDNSSYNISMDYSEKVIATLDELGLGTVFPRYYRVRLIPDDRDCLYKIAAYQFVYSDGEKWHTIYKANKKYFKNGRSENLINPGELYYIPSISNEERQGEYQEDRKYPEYQKGKVGKKAGKKHTDK